MLIEHCLFANCGGPGERAAVDIYDPYLINDFGEWNYNIYYDSRSAAGTNEFDSRLIQHHIYTVTSTVIAKPIVTNFNLYFSPSEDNIMRLGSTGAGTKDFSWTEWRALGRDVNGRFGNPNFVNYGIGNLNIVSGSNADFGGGVFAGPFAPDKVYSNVGLTNRTLLVFDGTGGAGGPIEPPAFSDEKFLNVQTRKYFKRAFVT